MKKFLPAILANLSAELAEILLMAAAAWLIVSAANQPPLSALSVGITVVRTAGIFRAALRYADRFFSHKSIFSFLDELREKIFLAAAKRFPLKPGLLHELTVAANLQKDLLPRVILPLATAFCVTLLLTFLLESFLPPILFLLNVLIAKVFDVKTADDAIYRDEILNLYDGRDELKIFGTAPAVAKLNSAAEFFAQSQESVSARETNFFTAIKFLNAAGMFFILRELDADRIYFAVWIFILLAAFEIFCAVPAAILTYKQISALEFENLPTKKIPQDITHYALRIAHLNFSYDGKNFVLKDFNLQVAAGEQVALVGESGAGKTTLLKLLAGLFLPSDGEIFLRGKVCAATADNFIFADSIRANFEIYCGEVGDEKIFDVLKICQLENFDVNAEIGEDGIFLSGGERVRLQIALALATDAEILLLDEPTASLDKIRAEKLIDAVKKFCAEKNQTLLVITHDKKIADKFAVRHVVGVLQEKNLPR